MDQTNGRAALAWVVGGCIAIALGAQISIPMVPVPTTLQTLAVFAVALAAGPRAGIGATGLYLALVLVGLPVLSDGQSHPGFAFVQLKSAGYVIGFIPAAALAGQIATKRDWRWLFAAALAGHAVVLALGVSVLALSLGPLLALRHGALPFLLAAVVKSALAAGFAEWFRRRVDGPPPHGG